MAWHNHGHEPLPGRSFHFVWLFWAVSFIEWITKCSPGDANPGQKAQVHASILLDLKANSITQTPKFPPTCKSLLCLPCSLWSKWSPSLVSHSPLPQPLLCPLCLSVLPITLIIKTNKLVGSRWPVLKCTHWTRASGGGKCLRKPAVYVCVCVYTLTYAFLQILHVHHHSKTPRSSTLEKSIWLYSPGFFIFEYDVPFLFF